MSVFALQPPAKPQEVVDFVAKLSACFQQMPVGFWQVVSEEITSQQFSRERLAHVLRFLMTNHMYPTLTMADILSPDKTVKIYSYNEFYRAFGTTEREGYCILAQKGRDGCIQYADTQLAKLAGLEIMRECII